MFLCNKYKRETCHRILVTTNTGLTANSDYYISKFPNEMKNIIYDILTKYYKTNFDAVYRINGGIFQVFSETKDKNEKIIIMDPKKLRNDYFTISNILSNNEIGIISIGGFSKFFMPIKEKFVDNKSYKCFIKEVRDLKFIVKENEIFYVNENNELTKCLEIESEE